MRAVETWPWDPPSRRGGAPQHRPAAHRRVPCRLGQRPRATCAKESVAVAASLAMRAAGAVAFDPSPDGALPLVVAERRAELERARRARGCGIEVTGSRLCCS